MLTARGWWFLLTVLGLLALGVLAELAAVATLALALLLWFGWEWLLFALRSATAARRVYLTREVCDDRGPVTSVWAGRTYEVRAEVGVRGTRRLPYAAANDQQVFGAEYVEGATQVDGPLEADEPLALSYRVRFPGAGRVRFDGVRLQLADPQGFFYHVTFVSGPKTYRVLPPLVESDGQASTAKRHNLLPPPGVHRLRRPGSGGELLDLRDYLPGDPPKTIAWKVSARRDRLITKEFESEVPLRCTLFVDTSGVVRLGPPGQNALARVIEIASSVAQANSAVRDLTGLCLFDDHGVGEVRPARGQRHLIGLLDRLADAAGLAPVAERAPFRHLLQPAYAFAQEVYPDLMRPSVNGVPFWLPWLTPKQPSARPNFALLAVVCLLALVLPSLALLVLVWAAGGGPNPLLLLLTLPLGVMAVLFVLLMPRDAKLVRWRKRLAALLSVRYGLAPGGLELLLQDNECFALYLQRFLAEHQVPFAPPLYDARGRFLFASPAKVGVLAAALTRAVGRSHDNELYVLLADLLELGDHLDPLLRSVRVALARHHQVIVVCPWPPGVPPPDARTERDGETGRKDAPSVAPALRKDSVEQALKEVTARRYHRAFRQVRQTFARLGVAVLCAESGEPVRLILERLDRLRGAGRRR